MRKRICYVMAYLFSLPAAAGGVFLLGLMVIFILGGEPDLEYVIRAFEALLVFGLMAVTCVWVAEV